MIQQSYEKELRKSMQQTIFEEHNEMIDRYDMILLLITEIKKLDRLFVLHMLE